MYNRCPAIWLTTVTDLKIDHIHVIPIDKELYEFLKGISVQCPDPDWQRIV